MKALRENLRLILLLLLAFCLGHALNSGSQQSCAAITVQARGSLPGACSQPGCGFDPYLAVENSVRAHAL